MQLLRRLPILLLGALLPAFAFAAVNEEELEKPLLTSQLRTASPLEMAGLPIQELFPEWGGQALVVKQAVDRFFEKARLSQGFCASNGVRIPGGTYRSYLPDKENIDNQFLAAEPRFWSYDAALAVYYLLKTDRPTEARKVVNALVGIGRQEKEAGFKGLWRFSYAPHYIDSRAPMGAVTWVYQAIYAYILQTGDTRHLEWLNRQLDEMLLDENSPLQRQDPADPLYGLVKAGYTGNEDEVAEHFILEHQHNACRVLRLSYWTTQRYDPDNREFLEKLVRRHDSLMTKIRELFYEDGELGYARFFTSLDENGRANPSEAWDNSGWMAWDAYDDDLSWKTLNRLMNRFAITLPVSLFEGVMPDRARAGERVRGIFFFTNTFKDPYVLANPKFQQMLQPEATFGVIIRLAHFAGHTTDPYRRQWAVDRANELWLGGQDKMGEYGGMLRLLHLYDSKDHPGYSYATLRVQDFFNSLRGVASNGTAGVLAAAFVNGASITDYLDVPAPPEMTVGGRAPLKHQPLAKLEPAAPQPEEEEPQGSPRFGTANVRPDGIESRLPDVLQGKWARFYIETDQLYHQGHPQQVIDTLMDFPVQHYVKGWDKFPGAEAARRRVLAFFETREDAETARDAASTVDIAQAIVVVEYSLDGQPKILKGTLTPGEIEPPVRAEWEEPAQEPEDLKAPVFFNGFTFQTSGGRVRTVFEDDVASGWATLGFLAPGKRRIAMSVGAGGPAATGPARRIFTQFDLSGDRLPSGAGRGQVRRIAPDPVQAKEEIRTSGIRTGDILLLQDHLAEETLWSLLPAGVKPVIVLLSPHAWKFTAPQLSSVVREAERSGRPVHVLMFDAWRNRPVALLDAA